MLKERKKELAATQDGDCIALDMVPDAAFADKLLGDGIAIIPRDNVVRSPADGEIAQVFDTHHAYSLKTDDGLEILVHIGINTVELKGEGFVPKVREGQRVKKGDVLCETDIELIRKRGYEIYTPMVITNMTEVKDFNTILGNVRAGESTVIEYTVCKGACGKR